MPDMLNLISLVALLSLSASRVGGCRKLNNAAPVSLILCVLRTVQPSNCTSDAAASRTDPTVLCVSPGRRPKLPVSLCGDDTRNYTCFNGGNCTDRELSCDCPPGFTGHR